MSTSKEAILIKGGVLLFAAGLSSGRLLLNVVNGNHNAMVYTLIAILLVPSLIVDGVCLGSLVKTLREPLPPREKRKLMRAPALYIVLSILGLITGFITFKAF